MIKKRQKRANKVGGKSRAVGKNPEQMGWHPERSKQRHGPHSHQPRLRAHCPQPGAVGQHRQNGAQGKESANGRWMIAADGPEGAGGMGRRWQLRGLSGALCGDVVLSSCD